MTEPLVRFSDLCDLLTTAGCEIGVELRGDEHAVVVTDRGRRVLRTSVAPAGAPAYQVGAAPLVLAVITTAGLAYLAVAKPHRRLAAS